MDIHIADLLRPWAAAIGKTHGDRVKVVIGQDTEPRVVTVPKDLQKLLDENPKGKVLFKKLSYTHRKEYVSWIESAKKEETRLRRLKRSLEMLKENVSIRKRGVEATTFDHTQDKLSAM